MAAKFNLSPPARQMSVDSTAWSPLAGVNMAPNLIVGALIVLGALNDAPVQHESKKLATVRTILPRTSAPPKWPVSSQTMAGNDR